MTIAKVIDEIIDIANAYAVQVGETTVDKDDIKIRRNCKPIAKIYLEKYSHLTLVQFLVFYEMITQMKLEVK